MLAQSCIFAEVVVAPDQIECPSCHQMTKRRWMVNRFAIDACLDKLGMLRVKVGVYRCVDCSKYFRNQPAFLYPDSIYTNRVISMALASVFEDGMPVCKVTRRFERDFGISPTEGTIRHWIKIHNEYAALEEDYNKWVVDSFSGVLCIDEVYQGNFAILLAVNPTDRLGDSLVGYQVVDGNIDSTVVEAFLESLKAKGIVPSQLVTDGSALYPDVVKRVWPSVAHQLCLFHQTQSMVRAVGEAVKGLSHSIPKDGPKACRNGKRIGRFPDEIYVEKSAQVFF